MATNEVQRKKSQAGIETTRGTGVAATRIVYADINHSYDRPIQEFPDRSGTYFNRRRIAYTRPVIGFTGTDLGTFEDLPWWMQLGMKGGVAGVSDGGTPPGYLYTFTPSGAVDDLKSVTLEFNEAGNPYEATQVMLNSWTIRVAPDTDGGWMFDFEALGRDWNTTTYTAALSERTTEVIPAPGTLVYLDDSGAAFGTTQLVGKVIDFSLTCNLNLHMKGFMEDATSWAANRVGRGARTFDATMTMEFDNDTEFAKYRATTATQRKLRVRSEGSTIHTTVKKSAEINMHGYWRSIGFNDREGNLTATFGMQSFYDAVAGFDTQILIKNALATLP